MPSIAAPSRGRKSGSAEVSTLRREWLAAAASGLALGAAFLPAGSVRSPGSRSCRSWWFSSGGSPRARDRARGSGSGLSPDSCSSSSGCTGLRCSPTWRSRCRGSSTRLGARSRLPVAVLGPRDAARRLALAPQRDRGPLDLPGGHARGRGIPWVRARWDSHGSNRATRSTRCWPSCSSPRGQRDARHGLGAGAERGHRAGVARRPAPAARARGGDVAAPRESSRVDHVASPAPRRPVRARRAPGAARAGQRGRGTQVVGSAPG